MADQRGTRIEVAMLGVLGDLVRLETRLFTEDAGNHDPLVDITGRVAMAARISSAF